MIKSPSERVLLEQRYSVGTIGDIVVLTLGSHQIRLFYQTAFEIAAAMRLAAKMGMRYEGMRTETWRSLLDDLNPELPQTPKTHPTFRRSNETSNVSEWRVDWNKQLVVIVFDYLECSLHFTDALKLHAVIRAYAKVAKAWAGDSGKVTRTFAHLNDAEENDKFVYVN